MSLIKVGNLDCVNPSVFLNSCTKYPIGYRLYSNWYYSELKKAYSLETPKPKEFSFTEFVKNHPDYESYLEESKNGTLYPIKITEI